MFRLLAPSLLALVLALPASAVSIVSNGGFETGDFTDWTQFGNTGFSEVQAGIGLSGSNGAQFGPVGSPGGITQILTTTPGQAYNITYWLAQNGSPGGGEGAAELKTLSRPVSMATSCKP